MTQLYTLSKTSFRYDCPDPNPAFPSISPQTCTPQLRPLHTTMTIRAAPEVHLKAVRLAHDSATAPFIQIARSDCPSCRRNACNTTLMGFPAPIAKVSILCTALQCPNRGFCPQGLHRKERDGLDSQVRSAAVIHFEVHLTPRSGGRDRLDAIRDASPRETLDFQQSPLLSPSPPNRLKCNICNTISAITPTRPVSKHFGPTAPLRSDLLSAQLRDDPRLQSAIASNSLYRPPTAKSARDDCTFLSAVVCGVTMSRMLASLCSVSEMPYLPMF